jgi:hypothetical protein
MMVDRSDRIGSGSRCSAAMTSLADSPLPRQLRPPAGVRARGLPGGG